MAAVGYKVTVECYPKMAAVRYKVAVDAYPRFKHFHDRLSSITSRLENLEAVGNFASCISMGKKKFANIMKEAKQLLKQDIHLTIVTNGVGIPLPDKLVSKLRVGDTESKMSWENIQEKEIEEDIRSLSKFQPHFVIFLAKSSMSDMREKIKQLLDKIHGNPENVVVHDITSDITYSYPELIDSTLKKQAEDLKEILKTVGLKIQFMLEDRAVEILENIVNFNRNFAPGDGQDMDLTISLECSQQVRENFDNEHIISDLDPEKNKVARKKIESVKADPDAAAPVSSSVSDIPAKAAAKSSAAKGSSRPVRGMGKAAVKDEDEEDELPTKSGKISRPTSGAKERPAVKTFKMSGKAPVDPECHKMVEKAHVYYEGKDIYDVMLHQRNVANNNNKYYIIQLLELNDKKNYYTWFRWGRVGYQGQNKLVDCGADLEAAKKHFMKKFSDKTSNQWANRAHFNKVPGKYDLLQKDYSAKEAEADEVDAPKKSGIMPEKVPDHAEIQTVLRRCQMTLVENLEPSPVLDEFLSKRIISSVSYRDIQATSTASERNRKIIDLIEKSGWSAYEAFKQCLQQSKQLDLHERLILEEKKLNIPEERSSKVPEAGPSATDQEAMETDGEPFDPQQKQQLTEEELETIFYEKYIEFLCMKTKCITCDHLAQKFGISGSLVNEFLNEGYFNYEESYRKAVEPMRKLRWSQVKKCREGSMVQYDYVMRQTSFLREAEDYVQKKVKLLAEFGKMNFEVYGLLRHTVVPVGLEMPVYPAVSREMSDDLLSLGEVAGCGTIYGKLTIHLKKGQPLTNHELKENIRKILIDYRFPQSFRLQELLETRTHARARARGSEGIGAGDQIKAQMTDDEYEEIKKQNKPLMIHNEQDGDSSKEKLGTLGCFIGFREKEKAEANRDKASGDGEDMKSVGAGDTESMTRKVARLYGITCAHCVTGCHPGIQVKKIPDGPVKDFGNTAYVLYDREKIDIAAVHLTMDRDECCSDISLSRWWDFYTGKAGDLSVVAKVVFKDGAVSGTTVGIIVSNDYRPVKSRNFDTEFHILVDIEPGQRSTSDEQGPSFSKSGDSGAVVYYRDIRDEGFRLASLLGGIVVLDDHTDGILEYSYSSHLKKSLDALCDENNLEIVMPWNVPFN